MLMSCHQESMQNYQVVLCHWAFEYMLKCSSGQVNKALFCGLVVQEHLSVGTVS